MDSNIAEPTCYRTTSAYASSSKQNGAFWYIVLRVMLLIYTRGMIRFLNCDRLSQMIYGSAHEIFDLSRRRASKFQGSFSYVQIFQSLRYLHLQNIHAYEDSGHNWTSCLAG